MVVFQFVIGMLCMGFGATVFLIGVNFVWRLL